MKRPDVLAATVLGLIVLASAWLPGDAQLLDDEPNLLHHALIDNFLPGRFLGIHLPFTLPSKGLAGSRGVNYGPMPVWFYQIFLSFTHDPITMVAARAILVNGITAIALAWLARTMGVSLWLAVGCMLSPWLWIYSRQLWDNSFCIPICATAMAAYADFLARRRGWALAVAAICALSTVLIHLMALAFVVPLVLHLLNLKSREAWRFKWILLAVAIVIVAFGWPYFHYVLFEMHSTHSETAPWWEGCIYPIFGGHHLTAAGIDEVLGSGWFYRTGSLAYALTIAQEISLLGYALVWIGMILAIPRAWRAIAHRANSNSLDDLALVALLVLICQSMLDAWMRAYDKPHYFNATWIAFIVFAFFACEVLARKFWNKSILIRAALPAYSISLVFLIVTMAATIHHNGGTRDSLYGVTMANQMEIAEQIAQYSSTDPLFLDFEQWQKYPGDQTIFRELNPPQVSQPEAVDKLIVRFRDQFPGDAHIILEVRRK